MTDAPKHDRANGSTSLRARVYWWLEAPDRGAIGPKVLELALMLLIALNILALMLETIQSIYMRWQMPLIWFERISLSIFIIEYFARLWVAPEREEGYSRWEWARSPLAIIDLLAILPALMAFVIPIDLRVLRVFRLLRILKFTRYSSALNMLLSVFEEEADSFFAGFFILVLMLVLSASGAWLAEHKAQPEAFGSIPAAMWWAVATLTTVGYGDVSPITVAGKFFGAMVTVVGIGMAALPAGIIASGLNDQLQLRRARLRREFRKALEDGGIDLDKQEEIETLRRRLGLSRHAVHDVQEEMLEEIKPEQHLCAKCRAAIHDDGE